MWSLTLSSGTTVETEQDLSIRRGQEDRGFPEGWGFCQGETQQGVRSRDPLGIWHLAPSWPMFNGLTDPGRSGDLCGLSELP